MATALIWYYTHNRQRNLQWIHGAIKVAFIPCNDNNYNLLYWTECTAAPSDINIISTYAHISPDAILLLTRYWKQEIYCFYSARKYKKRGKKTRMQWRRLALTWATSPHCWLTSIQRVAAAQPLCWICLLLLYWRHLSHSHSEVVAMDDSWMLIAYNLWIMMS